MEVYVVYNTVLDKYLSGTYASDYIFSKMGDMTFLDIMSGYFWMDKELCINYIEKIFKSPPEIVCKKLTITYT